MSAKTSMIVLVLASFQVALSYGNAALDESAKRICDAPALAGEGKDRLRMTGVSQPKNFLSQSVKDVPAVCMGDGLVYRYEVEEPSDDDEVMNAARKKIGETSPEAVEAAKEKLVELLKKETKLDLPLDNSEWLVRFLRLRDYDVQAAYKLIKNYYNFRAQNKKLFDGLNATSESDIIETNFISVLPKHDQHGSRLAVIQAKNWDSDRFSLVDVLKMGIVLGELGSYEPATQIAGVKLIMDMEGTTMKQMKKVTPSMLKKILEYSLNSAPYKNAGVHFVNENRVFQTLYKMMKPFITKELKSKMFFHQKNLDSLHRHIPASLLPKVYGGSYPTPTFTPAEWNSLLTIFDPEFQKNQYLRSQEELNSVMESSILKSLPSNIRYNSSKSLSGQRLHINRNSPYKIFQLSMLPQSYCQLYSGFSYSQKINVQ